VHWFDRPRFFREVERVLRPGGVLAIWSYGIPQLEGEAADAQLQHFYADIVGDVGFQTASAGAAVSAQNQLLDQLLADREAVSGVNIDEELLDMERYQKSYEAAARFLSVAQEMMDTLINLGR
jgi:flagellar hook-associated protein FlgK